MWLVVHKQCLTWGNLCKCGFQGLSMGVLCRASEESVSHLFFQCSFTRDIWHSWWNVWNQSCWHVSSLTKFFACWGKTPVQTSFLQVAWTIGPSFIIWHIWLERNRRIFRDEFLEVPCGGKFSIPWEKLFLQNVTLLRPWSQWRLFSIITWTSLPQMQNC